MDNCDFVRLETALSIFKYFWRSLLLNRLNLTKQNLLPSELKLRLKKLTGLICDW